MICNECSSLISTFNYPGQFLILNSKFIGNECDSIIKNNYSYKNVQTPVANILI